MKTIASTLLILLSGCGGSASDSTPPSGCVKGSGLYNVHCQSLMCSDGTGSCAANDPTDIQVVLQANGFAVGGSWITDTNTFTTDGCDQSIVAHMTSTVTGSMQTLHETVVCNQAGTSCTISSTTAIQTATAQGTCVEQSTAIKQ
jgi:hypothetical protein